MSFLYDIYHYVSFTLGIVSVLLHVVGLLAIYLHKKKINQSILLASMSVMEMAESFNSIVSVSQIKENVVVRGVIPNIFSRMVFYVASYGILLSMFVITLDRLVCVLSPFTYKSRMSRKRIQVLVLTTWLLALILGIGNAIHTSPDIRRNIYVLFLCLEGVYFLFIIVAYSLIIKKLKDSRNRVNPDVRRNERFKARKEILMPTVLVITYIIFDLVPPAVLSFHKTGGTLLVSRLLFQFGMATDAITYIFLTKHYRDQIIKVLCYIRPRRINRSDRRTRTSTIVGAHL